MKKIILIGLTVCGALGQLKAQDATGAGANVKVMSIAEANKLNGIAQPTINGKPYSQYAAEEKAKLEKNTQAGTNNVNNARLLTTTTAGNNNRTSNVVAGPDGKNVPANAINGSIPTSEKAVEAAKPTSVDDTKQSPEKIKQFEQQRIDAEKRQAILAKEEKPAPVQSTAPINLNSATVRPASDIPAVEPAVEKKDPTGARPGTGDTVKKSN